MCSSLKPCWNTAATPLPPTAAVRCGLCGSTAAAAAAAAPAAPAAPARMSCCRPSSYPHIFPLSQVFLSQRAMEVFNFVGALRSGVAFSVQQQHAFTYACIGSYTQEERLFFVFTVFNLRLPQDFKSTASRRGTLYVVYMYMCTRRFAYRAVPTAMLAHKGEWNGMTYVVDGPTFQVQTGDLQTPRAPCSRKTTRTPHACT